VTAHSQLAEPSPPPQRRRDPVRRVLARMRERRRNEFDERRRRPAPERHPLRTSLKRRMHHRKAALALSAGVMGMSAAAMGTIPSEPARAGVIQVDNPLTRMPARDLRASQALKEALVREEGVRDTVYRDVAGYATVGCGHLVTPADGLRLGDRIGYDRILDFLDGDLAEAEAAVTRIVGDMPLFQHEYDALVDLVYNVGEGTLSPKKSPRLIAAIAAHDYEAISRELEYRYAGGQLARGLAYRSARRTQIFMNAAYDDPRETMAGAVLARL
jgi:GH24 family phage-related lysozyme (muramidase)